MTNVKDDQWAVMPDGVFNVPPPTATLFPAADVLAPPPAQLRDVEVRSFPVRRPQEDLNDATVLVRSSVLTRCRARLEGISNARFPWHEVLLGIASLAAGASIGAIPAGIQPGPRYIFFFTVLPMAAIGAFVGYLALRFRQQADAATAATEVLADLPDPDKAT